MGFPPVQQQGWILDRRFSKTETDHKKKFLFIIGLLLLLLPTQGRAQWMKSIATGDSEYLYSVIEVDDIAYGPGFLAVGHMSTGGDFDSFMTRVSPDGTEIWTKAESDLLSDFSWLFDVAPASTGISNYGYVACGKLDLDMWLAMFDLSGDYKYGCTFDDGELRSVSTLENGHYAVTGTDGDNALVAAEISMGSNGCFVHWEIAITDDSSPSPHSIGWEIQQTADDGFIIVGAVDLDVGPTRDGIIIKLSDAGTLVWAKTIGNAVPPPDNESASFYSVEEVFDDTGNPDGFITAGTMAFDTFNTFDDNYGLVARLGADGLELWTTFWGYPTPTAEDAAEQVKLRSVVQSDSGRFTLIGSKQYSDFAIPVFDDDKHEVLVLELEEEIVAGYEANLLDARLFDNVPTLFPDWDNGIYAYGMEMTSSGGYIWAGSTDGDIQSLGIDENALLVRMNEDADVPNCTIPTDLQEFFPAYEWKVVDDFHDPGLVAVTTPFQTAPVFVSERTLCETCVRRVNKAAPAGSPDGLSWSTAFQTIQEGIDSAVADVGLDYCEIWVSQADQTGTDSYFIYVSDETDKVRMAFEKHIYGGFEGSDNGVGYGWECSRDQRQWESNTTIINGFDEATMTQQVYHVVIGSNVSTLDGFIVTAGYAIGPNPADRLGGGMYTRQSPTVRNCTFVGNAAYWGGAVAVLRASPYFHNCVFAASDLFDYAFVNMAFAGGAVANVGFSPSGGGPTYEDCDFMGNEAFYYGGAVYNHNSPVEIIGGYFYDNTAYVGGGVANVQLIDGNGAPRLESCEFSFNHGEYFGAAGYGRGGAVANYTAAGTIMAHVYMENCLVYDNDTDFEYGGAIFDVANGANSQYNNCTIADNLTGGVLWPGPGSVAVVNSIIWNNGPYEIYPDCDAGAIVYFSDIKGGCFLLGNIDSNPIFVPGTYMLDELSPCIDVANPAFAPMTDITGAYRDSTPDMGAYEYFPDGGP